MKNRSETFFTEEEKKAVEAAIKEAESSTSGEIVTVIVDSSGAYRDVDVITGIMFSAMLSVFPAELFFLYSEILLRKLVPSMNWFAQIPDGIRFISGLAVFAGMTILFYFPFRFILSKFPSLKRYFVSAGRMETEVRERALRAFHEHGLNRTKDATGVLFLLSIMEKRVNILADHGIYEKIKQETLDRYAAEISRGIASNKGAEALCSAIKDAGTELARYFPRKSDDRNELPDRVVTER